MDQMTDWEQFVFLHMIWWWGGMLLALMMAAMFSALGREYFKMTQRYQSDRVIPFIMTYGVFAIFWISPIGILIVLLVWFILPLRYGISLRDVPTGFPG